MEERHTPGQPQWCLHHTSSGECTVEERQAHLDSHGRVCTKHHLKPPNVALGAIRDKDLLWLPAHMGVEPVA